MLRLQLLGGVLLQDDSGLSVGAAASTRRALALLSALAASGESGLSRDKLVALLWPDTDVERARHSLTQALYEVRRAARSDDLFLGTADLRLNPARIASDLADFEMALASGDLERAIACYRGAFLDGFFLTGSAEFERWATAQRARLETRYAEALERLANDADARGDDRRALDWWRRLADLRPMDSGVILRLMQSMAAAGDRASALNLARVHGALLEEELGIAPDAAVTELAARLRATEPASKLLTAGASAIAATMERVTAIAASTVPGARRVLAGSLAALIVLLVLAVFLGERRRARGAGDAGTHGIVVAPFRVVGASPELRHLSEGIVELLSPRITGDSARSAEAGAVLRAWSAAGFTGSTDVPRSAALTLAKRLGAERVVTGSIVGAPSRMILAASVLRAPGGEVLADVSVDGHADSLPNVMDRLAAKLLLALAGEEADVAMRIARSMLPLSAVRSYVGGHMAARDGALRDAIAAYERALRIDSSFARAALRLASVGDRMSDVETMHRGIALAWIAREQLTGSEQALLQTWTGPRYPAPATADEQLASWRRFVDVAPRDPDAWAALGARLLHDGATAGIPAAAAAERARSSLERATALDSNDTAAAELLLQLPQKRSPPSAQDSLRPAPPVANAAGPLAPFLRWKDAVTREDADARARIRSRFSDIRPTALRLIAMASQYEATAGEDGERAARLLVERASDESERSDALEGLHSMLLNQGRLDEALAVTSQLAASQPGMHAYLRLRILDGMYGDGDSAAAAAAAADLEEVESGGLPGLPITSAAWFANRCVLAQWRLYGGDTMGVRRIIGELADQAVSTRRPRITTTPNACAELLDAFLAVVTRSADAAGRVARVESFALTPQTAGDGATYAPLLVARLYERLGDPASALRAIRRRTYMTVWPRYLAAMLRHEAAMLRGSDSSTTGGL